MCLVDGLCNAQRKGILRRTGKANLNESSLLSIRGYFLSALECVYSCDFCFIFSFLEFSRAFFFFSSLLFLFSFPEIFSYLFPNFRNGDNCIWTTESANKLKILVKTTYFLVFYNFLSKGRNSFLPVPCFITRYFRIYKDFLSLELRLQIVYGTYFF